MRTILPSTRRRLLPLLAGLVLFVGTASAGQDARRETVVVEDGVELHVEIRGEGDRTLLVPLPWIVGDLSVLEEELTVVGYDLRGRGRSTGHSEGLSLGVEIDLADLEAVRAHVGAERVSLLGASYCGALVALYAAEHPERVERIVMLGPMAATRNRFVTADAQREEDPALEAELAELRESGLREADPLAYCRAYWRLHARQLYADPSRAAEYDLVDCTLTNERPESFQRWAAAFFSTLGAWDFRPRVDGTPLPALVVQGSEDRITPPEGAEDWVEVLPAARLLEVPAAGHLPWEERPEVVRPAVVRFLTADPAERGAGLPNR